MRSFIFDVNGIFLISKHIHSRMERKLGVKPDQFLPVLSSIMDQVRRPNSPSCYQLFLPFLQQWGIRTSEKEFFQFWFSDETINTEILTYAQKLKEQGYTIFFLSNNFKERTSYYKQNFPNLFNVANKAYFSWETGYIKPDPRAWENIFQEQSINPTNCLYFDDSSKNITVAKSLGIHAYQYANVQKTKALIEKFISP